MKRIMTLIMIIGLSMVLLYFSFEESKVYKARRETTVVSAVTKEAMDL